jgi:hypothetical protein
MTIDFLNDQSVRIYVFIIYKFKIIDKQRITRQYIKPDLFPTRTTY